MQHFIDISFYYRIHRMVVGIQHTVLGHLIVCQFVCQFDCVRVSVCLSTCLSVQNARTQALTHITEPNL